MKRLDLVVVGYLLHDVIEINGKKYFALGGPAAYTSLAAKALGLNVGIVSKVGPEFKYHRLIESIDREGVSIQKRTTTFYNIYINGKRYQSVENIGEPISVQDFPSSYLGARFIHIGPVICEIEKDLLKWIKQKSNAKIILDPQGFLRNENNGWIERVKFDFSMLEYADIIKVSEDDIDDENLLIKKCKEMEKILIITRGEKGSELFYPFYAKIDAFPAKVVDQTGAGDVYVAGLVYGLLQGFELQKACWFASAVASFSVSRQGPSHSLEGFDAKKVETELEHLCHTKS
ncbi:MAG: PfkB family carbohydrate kinase [Candidatus Aenigmatarchaeota archaeon]